MNFKHFYDAGLQGSGTIKFRHYSASEPSSGETWVLNETINATDGLNTAISFSSNNQSFDTFYTHYSPLKEEYVIDYILNSIHYNAYNNGWTNEAYRTITFETAPTGDLLTWLQANGTKQGGGGTVTPDITVNADSWIVAGSTASSYTIMEAKDIVDSTSGTDWAKLEAVWNNWSSASAKTTVLSLSGLTENEANTRLGIVAMGDIQTPNGAFTATCDTPVLYITIMENGRWGSYKGTKSGTTFSFQARITGLLNAIFVYDKEAT